MSLDWKEMRQLRSENFIANTSEPNYNWLQEYVPADEQPDEIDKISHAQGAPSYNYQHADTGT